MWPNWELAVWIEAGKQYDEQDAIFVLAWAQGYREARKSLSESRSGRLMKESS